MLELKPEWREGQRVEQGGDQVSGYSRPALERLTVKINRLLFLGTAGAAVPPKLGRVCLRNFTGTN